jgi:ATP-dependent helicase/nuclease subunit A
MNLHKAKGLEADVVFLADPAGGLIPRVDVHIERTEVKSLGWLKVARKSEDSFAAKLLGEHADWPAHEAAELAYLQAEEDRLLYVAATRAREALVVSRSTEKLRTPAWAVLNSFLTRAAELPVPSSVNVSSVAPLDCTMQSAAAKRQTVAHSLVNQPSWEVTSVTAEAGHITRMTRSVVISADDPSKVVAADTPAHRADAGHAWGTLIHGLLEHAMRHKDATREDLQRLAMWLTMEQPDLRTVVDEAIDTVGTVSDAEFWKEARASVECNEETPFGIRVADGVVTKLLTGTIDLVYRIGDTWRLLDYKTDTHGSEVELRAKYGTQIDAYEKAWSRIVGARVTTALVPTKRTGI